VERCRDSNAAHDAPMGDVAAWEDHVKALSSTIPQYQRLSDKPLFKLDVGKAYFVNGFR
jgi:hypothetical protein